MFIRLLLAVLYWLASFFLAAHAGIKALDGAWCSEMQARGHAAKWQADMMGSGFTIAGIVGLAFLMVRFGWDAT